MTSWTRRHRPNRVMHFLNADGMVACNPRDREAAHRAETQGIATTNPQAVTCRKCRAHAHGQRKDLHRSGAPE